MTEQERNELHERIAQVKERVARAAEKAGKKPEDIILIAASKMNDAERVQEAIRAGIEVCGENRVQEYLINYRMDKAKELLVNTNLPIYQIAQQVGYEGALQFNKAFKNRMQVPPRTWRLQNRLRLSGDPDRK
mgnify:CR=1 FL=1